MDLRIVLGLGNLVVDVSNNAFFHHSRDLFNVRDSQRLLLAFYKRRTGLEGVDASSEITLGNLNQGVYHLV